VNAFGLALLLCSSAPCLPLPWLLARHHERTWRIDAIPWSFDEASALPRGARRAQ
jgi:hypothetical protein